MSIGPNAPNQLAAGAKPGGASSPVLSISGLTTSFMREGQWIPVVRNGRGRDYSPDREGADSGGEIPFPRVSASLLRRHAPARDDRDGAGLQAEAVDRRRADHRARRHDPGADPGAAQGSATGRG